MQSLSRVSKFALTCCAIFILLIIEKLPSSDDKYILFADNNIPTIPTSNTQLDTTIEVPYGKLVDNRKSLLIYVEIIVKIPEPVIAGNTNILSVNYSLRSLYQINKFHDNTSVAFENLTRPPYDFPELKFTFTCANLEIKPEETLSFGKRVSLPAKISWTFSAENPGQYNCLLKNSPALNLAYKSIKVNVNRFINEDIIHNEDYLATDIPITVYTIWRITRFQYESLKVVGAFIAFLLTLPFLKEIYDFTRRGLSKHKY